MKRRRRIISIVVAILAAVAGCFVTLVGPWPTYKSGFEDRPYYKEALAVIGPPIKFRMTFSTCVLYKLIQQQVCFGFSSYSLPTIFHIIFWS